MSNYPPGTSAGDPRAPWNQPEGETCPLCDGTGVYVTIDKYGRSESTCERCDGEGYVDPPTPQEIKEEREEMRFDQLRDEGRI